ncbi:hypothetical protein [Bacillus sp. Brlt_9]|uniref:hypothetical protein n=1 Tax=Bacillus sp. Brlt_9 TaxID=3110916 RepID=UPI003F7BAEEB
MTIKFEEIRSVIAYKNIRMVSYRTSTVWTSTKTFYLNLDTGKSVNLYTGSHTQWHWDPASEDLEKIMLNILNNAKVVKDITDTAIAKDMWFLKKMDDVIRMTDKDFKPVVMNY